MGAISGPASVPSPPPGTVLIVRTPTLTLPDRHRCVHPPMPSHVYTQQNHHGKNKYYRDDDEIDGSCLTTEQASGLTTWMATCKSCRCPQAPPIPTRPSEPAQAVTNFNVTNYNADLEEPDDGSRHPPGSSPSRAPAQDSLTALVTESRPQPDASNPYFGQAVVRRIPKSRDSFPPSFTCRSPLCRSSQNMLTGQRYPPSVTHGPPVRPKPSPLSRCTCPSPPRDGQLCCLSLPGALSQVTALKIIVSMRNTRRQAVHIYHLYCHRTQSPGFGHGQQTYSSLGKRK